MKKILLLFTDSYPLSKSGEAFLEPEIPFAISNFDEIYIFPSSRGKKNIEKRYISGSNVVINQVKREKIFVELIKNISYLLEHKGFWQDVRMFINRGLFFKISAWSKLIYTILTEAAIVRHFKKHTFNFDGDTLIYIYSYWLFGTSGGAIAIKNVLNNKKKVVFSRGHGTDIVGYNSLDGYSPLKKYYIDELDYIYPISNKGKEILISQYKKYNTDTEIKKISKKITPFYLGIEDIGEINNFSKGEIFTIISCSSVIPVKRLHLIIEALSLIKTINIKWIHLGAGYLLEDMKNQSQEILGDNIHYEFKGAMSRNEVIDFYKKNNVHLFINVSSSEGIPVSIMEAYTFGIPAIATNVGGTSEICQDGKNGFLLRKNFNISELSNLILEVISLIENNYEKYLELRDSAKEKMITDFSLRNHRKFYENILKKI